MLDAIEKERAPYAIGGNKEEIPLDGAFGYRIKGRINGHAQGTAKAEGGDALLFTLYYGERQSVTITYRAGTIGFDRNNTRAHLDQKFARLFGHASETDAIIAAGSSHGDAHDAPDGGASDPTDAPTSDIDIIIDTCSIELFAHEGLYAASFLIFPEEPLSRCSIEKEGGGTAAEITLITLRPTMTQRIARPLQQE